MARKPESNLQRKIREALQRELGGFWFKVHGGPFMAVGLPDLIGCVQGFYVGIEVKMPGEVTTPEQREKIRQIREAGGIAFVARSPQEAVSTLRTRLGKKVPRPL